MVWYYIHIIHASSKLKSWVPIGGITAIFPYPKPFDVLIWHDINLFLHFLLFPSIFSSLLFLMKLLYRNRCPIIFLLYWMVMNKVRFSFTNYKTSSLLFLSIQLILSILLQYHLSIFLFLCSFPLWHVDIPRITVIKRNAPDIDNHATI